MWKNDNTKIDFVKIVSQNIYLIEEGLKVIDTGILIQKSKLDILAIDEIGRLFVIELVKDGDETLIFEALDHFDWVFHNMDILQKKYRNYIIDPTLSPEIIFIADMFSSDFKRRISYLSKTKIRLYEYSQETESREKNGPFLKFKPVKFQKFLPEEKEAKTVDQIIKKISTEILQEKCRKCIMYITRLKQNIEIDTTKGIIQFNDNNEYFAGIYPFEDFFWINFNPDYWEGKKVDKNTKLDFVKLIA